MSANITIGDLRSVEALGRSVKNWLLVATCQVAINGDVDREILEALSQDEIDQIDAMTPGDAAAQAARWEP